MQDRIQGQAIQLSISLDAVIRVKSRQKAEFAELSTALPYYFIVLEININISFY